MKTKIPFVLLIIAIAITLPIRIYQYFFNIDSSTGFYESGMPLAVIFYIIFFVAVIAFLVVPYIFYREQQFEKRPRMLVGGAADFLFGLFILVANAGNLYEAFIYGGILTLQGLYLLLTVVSGLIMIFESPFILLGTELPNWFLTFSIIPPIWAFVKSLVTFMGFTTITTISDRVLTIFITLASMLFLFYNAVSMNGIIKQSGRKRLASISFAGAYILISVSLARIISSLCGAEIIEYSLMPNLTNLFLGILMLETAWHSTAKSNHIKINTNNF